MSHGYVKRRHSDAELVPAHVKAEGGLAAVPKENQPPAEADAAMTDEEVPAQPLQPAPTVPGTTMLSQWLASIINYDMEHTKTHIR
jgi:hypothetical protein